MPSADMPPGTSQLGALPTLAIDLETIGLDATRDCIKIYLHWF